MAEGPMSEPPHATGVRGLVLAPASPPSERALPDRGQESMTDGPAIVRSVRIDPRPGGPPGGATGAEATDVWANLLGITQSGGRYQDRPGSPDRDGVME